MQAHHIIEDLKELAPKYIGENLKHIPELCKLIKSSHKFHYGDMEKLSELFPEPLRAFQDSTMREDLIWPYDLCLFEYNQVSRRNGELIQYAILAQTFEEAPSEFEFHAFYKSGSLTAGKWLVEPLFCYVKMDGDIEPGKGNTKIMLVWNPGESGGIDFDPPFEVTDYFDKVYTAKFWVIICALRLLNAEGVAVKTIWPKKRLQAARKKKNKIPLFTYKTLVIDPKKPRYPDGEPKDMWKNRLHFCRAHKKHYSAERPAFGHFVGTVYCPAHIRGNKRLGAVIKDYVLKAGGKRYN